MSRIVAAIPIKTISKRVPRKNFRDFAGKPLYSYIISAALNAGSFDDVYVDTDSDEIKTYASAVGAKVIDRVPELAEDTANGNDLMVYHSSVLPDADVIFQLYATAPLLSADSIRSCVKTLEENRGYDSIFTVTEEYGWYWYQNMPVNYRPSVLPRSQDATPVVKESTGLYGIYRETVEKYRERIGTKPHMYIIPHEEALDIDTDFDFTYAEATARDRGVVDRVLSAPVVAQIGQAA